MLDLFELLMLLRLKHLRPAEIHAGICHRWTRALGDRFEDCQDLELKLIAFPPESVVYRCKV